jgi:hypothetical protein
MLPASRSRQPCFRLELRRACRRPFRLGGSSRRSPCDPEPLVGQRPHAARVGELPQLPWTRRVPTWLGHCAGSVCGGWATANGTTEMAPGEPAGRRSGPERSCNAIHLQCAHATEETSSGERQRHILPRAPACAIASGPRLERNATVPFLSRVRPRCLLARGLPAPCSPSAARTTRTRRRCCERRTGGSRRDRPQQGDSRGRAVPETGVEQTNGQCSHGSGAEVRR